MPINKIAYSSIEENQQNYINILRASQSVSDTGWSTYSDAAGVNPVDGKDGTASITWSQNTSNPLSGDTDLRLVKSGTANRQGDGVSIPFTIANRHLAKVLQISFDMELISGTYSSGDLRVSIVQDPNGTPIVIEPVNTNIQLGITNQRMRHIATFQTHISITSYRLCIHVSSTSALDYTVDFANFKVWEQSQSIGSVITDWLSYTPSSAVTNGTRTSSYRRSGGNIQINIAIAYTGTGSLNFTPAQVLPSGLSIDTSKISFSNNRSIVGYGIYSDTGVSNNSISYNYDSSTATFLAFGSSLTTPSTGDFLNLFLELPITGWGSSVAMSSDTGDGRVVSGSYYNGSQSSLTADVTNIIFDSKRFDTHNVYSTSTGIFTTPISGQYQFNVMPVYQSTGNVRIYAWINGIKSSYGGFWSTTFTNFQCILDLKLGDTVSFRCNTNSTLSPDSSNVFSISWQRISAGTQQIASSEGFNLQYTTTSNTHNSSGNVIDLIYGTLVKDSHSSYNTSTGIFTAPMSGCYDIEGQIVFSANATGYRAIIITNTSNTFIARGTEFNSNSFAGNLGMASVSFKSYPMLAGQQIKIRYVQNSGGNLSLSSDSTWNRLSITRVGNY